MTIYRSAETPAPDIRMSVFNVRDGLGDPLRADALVEDTLVAPDGRPSVAFFAEAYRATEPGAVRHVFKRFDAAGYEVSHMVQEITDDPEADLRPDAHGMMLIAERKDMEFIREIRLIGRYALHARMHEPTTGRPYDVFAHHASDDDPELRIAEARALVAAFDRDDDGRFRTPTAVLLSGGVIKQQGVTPLLLSAAQPFADMLPSTPPDPNNPPRGLGRIGSLAQRLSRQANGAAYRVYRAGGLRNADPAMAPTVKFSGIAVKMDHAMVSPGVEVLGHEVHDLSRNAHSGQPSVQANHRKVSATLRLR